MNKRAKVYLKAAELLIKDPLARQCSFYTAISEAGSTMEDDKFAARLFYGEPVPCAPVDERILALCFLAAMVEDE